MTTTTWTSAPAGMLGQGFADVRPYPGVVACPTAEPAQGTGSPIGGGSTAEVGVHDGIARLRPLTSGAVPERSPAPAAQKLATGQSFQNDGTTLGIHSPERPQS